MSPTESEVEHPGGHAPDPSAAAKAAAASVRNLPQTVKLYANYRLEGVDLSECWSWRQFETCYQAFLYRWLEKEDPPGHAAQVELPPALKALDSHLGQIATPALDEALALYREARMANRFLAEEALEGNVDAAHFLAEIVTSGVAKLNELSRDRPDVHMAALRRQLAWPVLISNDPEVERPFQVPALRAELGTDLAAERATLRKSAGGYTRRWAVAAVRTIEETAHRMRFFSRHGEGIVVFARASTGPRLDNKFPDWAARSAVLPPFNRASLDQWQVVARAMIREQMPDFHLHRDWEGKRASKEQHGRPKTGDVQNAILDAVTGAMKTLAPK